MPARGRGAIDGLSHKTTRFVGFADRERRAVTLGLCAALLGGYPDAGVAGRIDTGGRVSYAAIARAAIAHAAIAHAAIACAVIIAAGGEEDEEGECGEGPSQPLIQHGDLIARDRSFSKC